MIVACFLFLFMTYAEYNADLSSAALIAISWHIKTTKQPGTAPNDLAVEMHEAG